MQLGRLESFSKFGIFLILGLMVALDLWFTLASVTTIASSGGISDAIEFVGVFIVFFIAPMLALASNVAVIRYQLRTVGTAYFLFALVIAEHFTIMMSWGLHAFAIQSVGFGLAAVVLAIYILNRTATSNAG